MVEQHSAADRSTARDWQIVDQGWGRKAVDFATLSEPGNCREYVAMHHRLGVTTGDRLLDVACGSGLATELAAIRGASCAGIDASPRLIEVARSRNPGADLRVGDMHAMPWEDASFDVVTSFRGIWGTTPDAVGEVLRVLAPGGRLGITVWGHIKRSPGAWALQPFTLASQPKVANQAAMVALGRPGAGEAVLARFGFTDIERFEIPFAWEFADPHSYARALASTGPAFEAMESIGEEAFMERAVEVAAERVRDGLPLRAEIAVVGYSARKPAAARRTAVGADTTTQPRPEAGFINVPEVTDEVQRLFDDDVKQVGYVMNASRLWGHLPETHDGLFDLMRQAAQAGSLSYRQRGILVTACASSLGDSYCSLVWGNRLANEAGAELAGGVLRGNDEHLAPSERALATWARQVSKDPNGATVADVQALRDAGFDDAQIFAVTVFLALRVAFSTVNDALGARPDGVLTELVPESVRDAVTFGRPIAAGEIKCA